MKNVKESYWTTFIASTFLYIKTLPNDIFEWNIVMSTYDENDDDHTSRRSKNFIHQIGEL
jgi:hypothetical protein